MRMGLAFTVTPERRAARCAGGNGTNTYRDKAVPRSTSPIATAGRACRDAPISWWLTIHQEQRNPRTAAKCNNVLRE
jgi:hypothetical protein